MKKINFSLFFAFIVHSVTAQFYINGYTGYSIATNPKTVENFVVKDTLLSVYNAIFSYGKGMNVGLGLGYTLNENISLELSCNTQLFTVSKFSNDWSVYENQGYDYYVSGINGDVRMQNNSIQLSPLFIYTVKYKKICPYVKTGINFIYTTSKYEEKYRSLFDGNLIESTYTYSGGWNVGFRGALGVCYLANEKLYLYSEFMAINTNYNYLESELVSHKVNGADELSTIDSKESEFQNNEGLIDYSHIGINIGIKYVLNNN